MDRKHTGNQPVFTSHGFLQEIHAFHTDTTAAASVEYAVVIMLVLIGTLVGLDYLNDSVHTTFESVAHTIEAASHAEQSQSNAAGELAQGQQAKRVVKHSPVVRTIGLGRTVVMILSTLLFGVIVYRIWRKNDSQKSDKLLRSQMDEIPADLIFQKRHEIMSLLFDEIETVHRWELQIGQVMTRKIKTVLPSAPVSLLKQIVTEEKKRHLLVCDSAGALLGVISDRDILGREGSMASDLMTADPLTVQRDDLLDPAVTMLIQKRISCLPVTHQGKLCGLLTSTDVMMALQCLSQVMQRLAAEPTDANLPMESSLEAIESDIQRELALPSPVQ